ncbi:MAG: cation-transporting P-type ATPase [Bdellovibrionaceae bacterium]|nr:cation-transporting P-type ATPase [Pseudobdellovibrionaceae bacterium]
MSERSLRVLGFAQAKSSDGWIWLGLIGLYDAPRSNMKKTLARFHRTGIRTIMITGDQASTAEALAHELGLANGEQVVTVDMREQGKSDEELLKLAPRAHVFARVAPIDKRRIVQALKSGGHIVGMVGDGINDALALKSADVGIAIGESGSSVAREIANVILLDDRISRLIEAIQFGRAAGESMRKAVRYLVTTNLAEMGVVIGETALNLPEVMDPLQLLWMNMVTDTFPALALAMDRPRSGIMETAPPPADQPMLSREEIRAVSGDASKLLAPVALGLLYGHARGLSKTQNQTIALNILVISQMLKVLNPHAPHKISWRDLLRSHRPLLAATFGSLGAHFSMSSIPPLRSVFKLVRLNPVDLAVTSLIPVLTQRYNATSASQRA